MRREIWMNGVLVEVQDLTDPEPTPDAVREETLRRLMAAFGARDRDHLSIRIQDAQLQAGVLADKQSRGETLAAAELDLAARLRRAVADYLAIKAAGNALETATPIPADFAADRHWPGLAGHD